MYISSNEVPSQNQLAIGGVTHKLIYTLILSMWDNTHFHILCILSMWDNAHFHTPTIVQLKIHVFSSSYERTRFVEIKKHELLRKAVIWVRETYSSDVIVYIINAEVPSRREPKERFSRFRITVNIEPWGATRVRLKVFYAKWVFNRGSTV